jgi:hypothetical protein
MGVQIVPDDNERAAESLMRGVQQAGVAGLGEAFAPAPPAGVVSAVDQPGPVPGLGGDQHGRRQARAVAA